MEELAKGLVAQKGKVIGIARIITENNLSSEFNAGDILVAEFTSPIFVPFMKKAAAIITDMGGQLCHAAIVAREIGVPCIVGTKNASKVIKQGRKILVDANKGIIYGI